MDVIGAAKKISEVGTSLDKLANNIADEVGFLCLSHSHWISHHVETNTDFKTKKYEIMFDQKNSLNWTSGVCVCMYVSNLKLLMH